MRYKLKGFNIRAKIKGTPDGIEKMKPILKNLDDLSLDDESYEANLSNFIKNYIFNSNKGFMTQIRSIDIGKKNRRNCGLSTKIKTPNGSLKVDRNLAHKYGLL